MLKIVPSHVAAGPPTVGIFWRVGQALLVDATPLADAETYSHCITHSSGHHELWEAWQSMGSAGRAAIGVPDAVGWTEYDEWPRGRIVHYVPERRFILYADRRLTTRPIVGSLSGAFGLAGEAVLVQLDSHYR